FVKGRVRVYLVLVQVTKLTTATLALIPIATLDFIRRRLPALRACRGHGDSVALLLPVTSGVVARGQFTTVYNVIDSHFFSSILVGTQVNGLPGGSLLGTSLPVEGELNIVGGWVPGRVLNQANSTFHMTSGNVDKELVLEGSSRGEISGG